MHSYRKRGKSGVPVGGYTVAEGGVVGLQYIHENQLGVANGIAQFNDKGQIAAEQIDIVAPDEYVSLVGPRKIQKGVAAVYTISNYGFIRTYAIRSDYGSISRVGNQVTFVPNFAGLVTFVVGTRTFEVLVQTDKIELPTIAQIGYDKANSGTLTVKTSPFRPKESTDTHLRSGGLGSKKLNFDGDYVFNTISAGVDRTVMVQGGVTYPEVFHLRAYHEGVVLGQTDWGPTKSYRRPQALYPYVTQDLFINPVLKLVIPTGGYIRIKTDTGFTQTYTTSQTVTLNNQTFEKIVAYGKGGNSTRETVPATANDPAYQRDVEGPVSTLEIDGQLYSFPGDPNPTTKPEYVRPISNAYRATDGVDGAFGKSTSLDTTGKRLLIGSPRGSWGGQLHLFESINGQMVPVASWLAGVPTGRMAMSIPAGGAVMAFGQTFTANDIVDIPEDTTDYEITGFGGMGSTISTPGVESADPSEPVYETQTQSVWVEATPDSWVVATVEEFTFDNGFEADASRTTWLSMTTEGQRRTATAVAESTSQPGVWSYSGTTENFVPGQEGHFVDQDVPVLIGYADPGQEFVAPTTENVTGDVSTVTIAGRSLAFPGGDGAEAMAYTMFLSSSIESIGENVYLSKDGKVIFAGSPKEVSNSLTAGAVYETSTGTSPGGEYPQENLGQWSALRRIGSPIPAEGADFGRAICSSADGARVFIGAPGENAVYYFVRNAGNLVFKQRIVLASPPTGGGFGTSMSCSDNAEYVVIGSPKSYTNEGALYVFRTLDGETFLQSQEIRMTKGATAFTYSVPSSGSLTVDQLDTNGNLLLSESYTGSGTKTMNTNTRRLVCRGNGAANNATDTILKLDAVEYVFPSSLVGAAPFSYMTAPRIQTLLGLGTTVDMSSDGAHIWAGIPNAKVSFDNEGIVAHFVVNVATWEEKSRVVCPRPIANGLFGNNVECSNAGTKIVVGFPGNTATKGEVFTGTVNDDNNVNLFGTFYIDSANLYQVGADPFGSEVSISGNGAVYTASNPGLSNGEGSVYAFLNL